MICFLDIYSDIGASSVGYQCLFRYKALVASIPFRKRSIPIAFTIYTNQQIRDMVYRSKNDIVWNFMDRIHEMSQRVLPEREAVFIFDRGFAGEGESLLCSG